MTVDDIVKALNKNPKKWAEMFVETQRMLDVATTELQLYEQTTKIRPQGTFDSVRAESMISLIQLMMSQMYDAFDVERDVGKGSNIEGIGKPPTEEDLDKLYTTLLGALQICKAYKELKGQNPDSEVSLQLRENNPCNVQIAGPDGQPRYGFKTVEDGLANTLRIVKWMVSQQGPSATYRVFLKSWFMNFVDRDALFEKALKELSVVRDPDALFVHTTANYILVTKIITSVEYDRPVDRAYLEKHYTLDKFVQAASLEASNVSTI